MQFKKILLECSKCGAVKVCENCDNLISRLIPCYHCSLLSKNWRSETVSENVKKQLIMQSTGHIVDRVISCPNCK